MSTELCGGFSLRLIFVMECNKRRARHVASVAANETSSETQCIYDIPIPLYVNMYKRDFINKFDQRVAAANDVGRVVKQRETNLLCKMYSKHIKTF